MAKRKPKRKTREELEREQREDDARYQDEARWRNGYDGQRYVPKLEE